MLLNDDLFRITERGVGVDRAPKDAYHFIFKCKYHIIAGNSFYS